MTTKLGVVMDPIQTIHVKKDSTLAMLLAAQERGWDIYYMQPHDLFLQEGTVFATMGLLKVSADPEQWFELAPATVQPLTILDTLLMRKDPPFNMEYIYTTYLLEIAERAGVLVYNKPQSLRDANEKLFTAWFPQCCPPTLVTSQMTRLHAFLHQHGDIIVKPLHSMGGDSVFRVRQSDPNINVIFETLTHHGTFATMAQVYLPAISQGDKRILMVNGEPVPFALARMAQPGETRANLAAGGTGVGVPLTDRDRWICEQIGPTLREKGLIFVGIDVIGDYLTEINVTSPTCIREIDAQFNINIGSLLIDCIERFLSLKSPSNPR